MDAKGGDWILVKPEPSTQYPLKLRNHGSFLAANERKMGRSGMIEIDGRRWGEEEGGRRKDDEREKCVFSKLTLVIQLAKVSGLQLQKSNFLILST